MTNRKKSLPTFDEIYALPWFIREELMCYLIPCERIYFDRPAGRRPVGNMFSQITFNNKKPPFPLRKAQTIVGPHPRSLKLNSLKYFSLCGLVGHTPNLDTVSVGKDCNFRGKEYVYAHQFVEAASSTILHLNSSLKSFNPTAKFIRLLPNLTSLHASSL